MATAAGSCKKHWKHQRKKAKLAPEHLAQGGTVGSSGIIWLPLALTIIGLKTLRRALVAEGLVRDRWANGDRR
jgi:hypothetical protein